MRAYNNHHHRLSLNLKGRWGTTVDFTTNFLHFSLFSIAHRDLANSRPVHFLKLSSHLFLSLPCLLPPLTAPCKMVLARPDERETWPYHGSLPLFTIVRKSSCGSIARWILARTSSFGNMVFVWGAQYLAITPHFYGLYYSSQFCCEGPWFTVIFKVIVIRWLFRPDENICGWLGVHCQITNSFAVSRTYFLTMFSFSYGLLYRTIVSRWTLR